jgi:hypothetical protein
MVAMCSASNRSASIRSAGHTTQLLLCNRANCDPTRLACQRLLSLSHALAPPLAGPTMRVTFLIVKTILMTCKPQLARVATVQVLH